MDLMWFVMICGGFALIRFVLCVDRKKEGGKMERT